MMSKKIKKKEKVLLLIVIFQILLIITLTFADSYTLHQTDSLIENSMIKDKKEKNIRNLISSGINLLIGFLSIKQVGTVSAQEGVYCCLETCQDISDSSQCPVSVLPTKCELTNECRLGTCVDHEYATCSAQSPKVQCEQQGGTTWYNEPIDKISECQTGCCTLEEGAYKQFTRKISCIKKGGTFDSSILQSECKTYSEQMGACVSNNNGCQFITQEACENILNGDFHQGLLCSNPDLGTICSMPRAIGEIRTICYNDKVYFMDNCSNIANIYHASKWDNIDYWSVVQAPTCNDGKGNAGSANCGNCDSVNSVCASPSEAGVRPTYGNYACKDITCTDQNGEIKKSGEAWCVYEGYVGGYSNEDSFSSNVIGGQHWKVYCDKGKIKIDPCDPYGYRGRICGEKTIEGAEGSLSIARCRFNEGWKCFTVELESYEYDDDGKIIDEDGTKQINKEACEEFSDCRLQSVDFYEKGKDLFKFDACVPKYPPGLNFWDAGSNAKNLCGIASVKCTIVERKGIGGWKCKGNCECLEQNFTEQMNDLCVSLGDCGGYINVEGEYTKNFKVRRGEDSISDSKKTEYLSMLTKENTESNIPMFFSSTEQGYFGGDPLGEIDWLGEEIKWGFGTFLAVSLIVTGGLGAVALGLAKLSVAAATLGPIGVILGIIAAILAAIFALLKLFGIGKTREISISFECLPWQPPKGGEDCDKCNKGGLPCTEYKCRSLGSACRLIDEDELYEAENPVCINRYPNDNIPPQINLKEIDRSVYEITNRPEGEGIKIRTSGGECIQEFTSLNFILKTENETGGDDYAKCIYNWYHIEPDPAEDYENVMDGELFKEINFYSITHTFEGRLPFVTNEYVSDVTGNLGERTGQLNMYVRCEDFAGNFNFNEYIINFCIKEGPDNTAAKIMEFIPKNKSFLAYGEITKSLTISLNEPAECRWSKTAGKLYDEMTDFELCEDYTGEIKSRWDCAARLTNLTETINNIYIKCKDQPWICDSTQEDCDYTGSWTEEDRNVNTEDFLYVLLATQNPLNITFISPQGTFERGGKLLEINLEAATSEGVNNGIAICKYRFVESPSGITSGDFFFETNSTRHRQPLSPPVGNYNIGIECNDEAGNKATGNAIFNLIVDSAAPRIVRAYKSGNSLKLITDEEARCYYSLVSCNFNFEDENVVSITTAYSIEHTANWNPGQKYYIKCEDTWENRNSGCAIIISPA